MDYLVAAFYRFQPLEGLPERRRRWRSWGEALNLRGTILLAPEGINAALAGDPGAVAEMVGRLREELGLETLPLRESQTTTLPFGRFKMRIKREIVALGRPEINPRQGVGVYVPPEEWNALIQDPEVMAIDTRNAYEVAIGTFPGAVDPQTRRFRDFPDYVRRSLDPEKNPKLALFCTGGIRCEKATALLKRSGFRDVYHLEGGILNYLEKTPPAASLWQGECFVFDERVAVDGGLKRGSHRLCPGCGHPLPSALTLATCPHCAETL
ncbi:MAG: rhodanese-related sulfurtransferase [Cyanobacteria bacterium RI_101]|nr:rhodanese-related sulfurtransferase [Cyanobacteria bacterium RI_101]